jgi:hypothetical protein
MSGTSGNVGLTDMRVDNADREVDRCETGEVYGYTFSYTEFEHQEYLACEESEVPHDRVDHGDDELNDVALMMLPLSVVEGRRHLIRSSFKQAYETVEAQHKAYYQANNLLLHDESYESQEARGTITDSLGEL